MHDGFRTLASIQEEGTSRTVAAIGHSEANVVRAIGDSQEAIVAAIGRSEQNVVASPRSRNPRPVSCSRSASPRTRCSTRSPAASVRTLRADLQSSHSSLALGSTSLAEPAIPSAELAPTSMAECLVAIANTPAPRPSPKSRRFVSFISLRLP